MSKKQWFFSSLLFLALATVYLTFIRRSSFWLPDETFFTLFDDAMISLRYAKNFADGHGLVWNPSEKPVEGYTNFLWTLQLSAFHFLPIAESKISLVVMLWGALLLILLCAITSKLAWDLTHSFFPTVATLMLVGLSYPLIFWTLRGMEVGWVSLLMTTSLWLALFRERSTKRLTLLGALLWLTRPDTLPFIGLIGLYLFRERSPRKAIQFLGPIFLVICVHTCFRWQYYGDWVPNTYYLKMGTATFPRWIAGLNNLTSSYQSLGLLPLLAAFARRSQQHLLLAGTFLLQSLYSIHTGGDAWEWMPFSNRYLTVALPALSVLSSLGLARFISQKSLRPVAVAAVLAVTYGQAYHHWVMYNYHHYYNDMEMVRYGLDIRNNTDSNTTLAVVWAGALPYFARRSAIDLLGKSDTVIAKSPPQAVSFYAGHMKWDYHYSIKTLRPDVVTPLFQPTLRDHRLLAQLGYQRIGNYWLQPGNPKTVGLERQALKQALWDQSNNHHDRVPESG